MTSHRPLGRLAREDDFRRVYREGTRRSSAFLVIHALPNRHGLVRVGVVVGRRFGRAVARNRLRRRLREAVRAEAKEIRRGWDLIVVPRDTAAGASVAVLRGSVADALEAGGILAADPGGA